MGLIFRTRVKYCLLNFWGVETLTKNIQGSIDTAIFLKTLQHLSSISIVVQYYVTPSIVVQYYVTPLIVVQYSYVILQLVVTIIVYYYSM